MEHEDRDVVDNFYLFILTARDALLTVDQAKTLRLAFSRHALTLKTPRAQRAAISLRTANPSEGYPALALL
jgi:hypothetical protein